MCLRISLPIMKEWQIIDIAVCLLQVSEGSFETHGYLDSLKDKDNIAFKGKVLAYKEKYILP